LREDKDAPAINQSMACNYAIAGIELLVQSEVVRAVHDQLVKLFKRFLIEQELNPFTRGHFSRSVLFLHAFRSTTQFRFSMSLTKLL
jgi:hypothetical protein